MTGDGTDIELLTSTIWYLFVKKEYNPLPNFTSDAKLLQFCQYNLKV